MMEAARTSETSVDNYFTRQYIPEDNSEHQEEIQSIILQSARLALKLRYSDAVWTLVSTSAAFSL